MTEIMLPIDNAVNAPFDAERAEIVCSECGEGAGGDCVCEWCDAGEHVVSGNATSICERCDGCGDCCECSHCRECCEPCGSICRRCDQCENCCECHTCSRSRCSRIVSNDEWCSDCERCHNCCECQHCTNCGDAVECTCSECDCCDGCCSCDESGANFKKRPVQFHASESFDTNASRRFASVELECSECDSFGEIDATCDKWSHSVVEDGSLPNSGFEVNTSPANGDRLLGIIEDLCNALKEDGAEVGTTCGYHVHVDARDFTHADVLRLIQIYARVEEGLFSVVAKSRRDNQYCCKCGSDYLDRVESGSSVTDKAEKAAYGKNSTDVEERRKNKYDIARYAALNLHSWFFRGTIECRMHSGTTKAGNVKAWAQLWIAILDYAKTPCPLWDKLPDDSFQALMSIAPTLEVRDWLVARRAKFSS